MIVALQAVLVLAIYYGSFLLRLDFKTDTAMLGWFRQTWPAVLVTKLIFFYIFGLLSGWWRFVGVTDLFDITKAAVSSSVTIFLIVHVGMRPNGYPRSVFIIDWLLTILVIGGVRFIVRAYTEQVQTCNVQKKMLVIGAGRAGSDIVRELRRNPSIGYLPVGFVDDNASKVGIKIHGIKVLGTTELLPELIDQHDVQCVLIAILSAPGSMVQRVIRKCKQCNVEFRILQAFGARINGYSPTTEMRSVRVEDLLGRQPVRLHLDDIRRKLTGKVVLITGAGGSIGSELSRQVAAFDPQRLVLFERSENALFKIATELATSFPHLDCVPVVGDILDVALLRDTFAAHRPQSVFHAAAYKHVPMMEQHWFQAITNNVFGTYNVALISRQYQVDDFVLISSDKAVKPTNVMGVTKRICELIVLALQQQRTKFIAVRFGNVLGSDGSVLPLFQEQIARGGPVLVTHPDVKRYFMTIPEAVQLVLEASSMGHGGEIFVLKMGEPIRILDLATNVIRLSGYEPSRDIKIVFTGLRPGEKLSEELLLDQEGIKPTPHENVCVLDAGFADFRQICKWIDELTPVIATRDVNAAVVKLREIVPEYVPSKEILARCEIGKHDIAARYRRATAELSLAQAAGWNTAGPS